jgi:gag-polyprotein putative aspartyl protease
MTALPWDIVKNTPIPISVEEFVKFSPAAKAQIHMGLANTKPNYTTIGDNSVNNINIPKTKKSSTYTIVTINNYQYPTIVNTGAASCVVSLDIYQDHSWEINATKHEKLTIGDGSTIIALGRLKSVPFTVGGCTIEAPASVIDTKTYNIILGTNWLHKAKACLDISTYKLQISQNNRKYIVELTYNRGIINEFHEEDQILNLDDPDQEDPLSSPEYNSDSDSSTSSKSTAEVNLIFPQQKGKEHIIQENSSDSEPDYLPNWQKKAADRYSNDKSYRIPFPSHCMKLNKFGIEICHHLHCCITTNSHSHYNHMEQWIRQHILKMYCDEHNPYIKDYAPFICEAWQFFNEWDQTPSPATYKLTPPPQASPK